MKLSQIGEFGLIARIAAHGTKRPETLIGIGDDTAVIKPNGKKLLLATTDALIENIHFKRKGLSFAVLGRKALLANISDIAAMGGVPTHALVTIGLPKDLNVRSIDEFYSGINALAKKYRIDIIGGDTVASPKEIVISITLLGEVEKKNLLLRSTARPGDLICVTGVFGGPAAVKYDSRKQKVESRTQEARIIARTHIATSMIDSSDGLVRSVLEICRASRVGARIREDRVPRAKGATLGQALYGGEEYELVFTVSPAKIRKANNLKVKMTVVGEVVSSKLGVKLVDKHDRIKSLRSGGYEHFIK